MECLVGSRKTLVTRSSLITARGPSRLTKKEKQMKKYLVRSVVVFASLTIGVLAVYAANVHLKGALTSTDNGTTDTVCGKLTGLGNGDLTISLVGSGIRSSRCTNPAGNFAPGNPGEILVSGVTTVPSTEIKNGNVSFCVTTDDPTCATAKDCGCPNNNWNATITDVDFTSLTLVVEQGGKVVLSQTVK
jgi:hypothetical protein